MTEREYRELTVMNSIIYPGSSKMEDDDMCEDNSMSFDENEEEDDSEIEEDIEEKLDNLNSYDNEKQLNILRKEIGHICVHGMIPPEGWYDERYRNIYEYSKLNWAELAKRFQTRDEFIHNTAVSILHSINDLLEERSTKPNFHLNTYYRLIHDIHSVWHYYKKIYVGDEADSDVLDLIEGMKFL